MAGEARGSRKAPTEICMSSLHWKVEHLEGLYTVAQTLVHNPQTLTQKQSRQLGIASKRVRGAGATGTTEVQSLLGCGGSGPQFWACQGVSEARSKSPRGRDGE